MLTARSTMQTACQSRSESVNTGNSKHSNRPQVILSVLHYGEGFGASKALTRYDII